jgi:very-short-patch-repair endonuclease
MTLGEVLLWNHLKGKKRGGLDFHRQTPIDLFIVDFFCPDLALAIEIDGSTHDFKVDRDQTRQRRLQELGVRFLRLSEQEVRRDPLAVVESIDRWIAEHRKQPR